jgi:cell shape-determining protein MreC
MLKKENEMLKKENETVKKENETVKKENEMLKKLLSDHGIEVPECVLANVTLMGIPESTLEA